MTRFETGRPDSSTERRTVNGRSWSRDRSGLPPGCSRFGTCGSTRRGVSGSGCDSWRLPGLSGADGHLGGIWLLPACSERGAFGSGACREESRRTCCCGASRGRPASRAEREGSSWKAGSHELPGRCAPFRSAAPDLRRGKSPAMSGGRSPPRPGRAGSSRSLRLESRPRPASSGRSPSAPECVRLLSSPAGRSFRPPL